MGSRRPGLLSPAAFDEDVISAAALPARLDPTAVALRWPFVTARNPNVAAAAPRPVAVDPREPRSGGSVHHLATRRRRSGHNDHLTSGGWGCYHHCRGSSWARRRGDNDGVAPIAINIIIPTVPVIPARCDPDGVRAGSERPAASDPEVLAGAPAPVSADPHVKRGGSFEDDLPPGWRRRRCDHDLLAHGSRCGSSHNRGHSRRGRLVPVTFLENPAVGLPLPLGLMPDDVGLRRDFPAARFPDVSTLEPAPVSGHPVMLRRRLLARGVGGGGIERSFHHRGQRHGGSVGNRVGGERARGGEDQERDSGSDGMKPAETGAHGGIRRELFADVSSV